MEDELLEKKTHFELALLAQQGNEAARDLLLKKHQPILKHVAGQYTEHPLPYDDRHAIAVKAFFEAIRVFDPNKLTQGKTTFRSFLRNIARNKILDADTNRKAKGHRVQTWHLLTQLHEELERLPSLEELSEHLGITPEGVRTRLLMDQDPGRARSGSNTTAGVPKIRLKGNDLIQAKKILKTHLAKRLEDSIQYQVAVLMVQGLRQREIATRLGIPQKSAGNAYRRIRTVLGQPPRKPPKHQVTEELANKAMQAWWLTEKEKNAIKRFFIDKEKPNVNDNRVMNRLAKTMGEHASRTPPKPKPETYRME